MHWLWNVYFPYNAYCLYGTVLVLVDSMPVSYSPWWGEWVGMVPGGSSGTRDLKGGSFSLCLIFLLPAAEVFEWTLWERGELSMRVQEFVRQFFPSIQYQNWRAYFGPLEPNSTLAIESFLVGCKTSKLLFSRNEKTAFFQSNSFPKTDPTKSKKIGSGSSPKKGCLGRCTFVKTPFSIGVRYSAGHSYWGVYIFSYGPTRGVQ